MVTDMMCELQIRWYAMRIEFPKAPSKDDETIKSLGERELRRGSAF